MTQNDLQDSMIMDDNNYKINEKDIDLDFNEKEEYEQNPVFTEKYNKTKELIIKAEENERKKHLKKR